LYKYRIFNILIIENIFQTRDKLMTVDICEFENNIKAQLQKQCFRGVVKF